MGEVAFSKPVEDSVPKVDDAVAVGEDLEFQERWWKFERGVWIFFVLVLIADLLGAFGRGWLAKAERRTADGMLDVKYERIERASTPSVMTVQFGRGAIRDGRARLFVSESVVKELGAQRIVPQPESSTIGDGGVVYTFPATTPPATIQLQLQPSFAGLQTFSIGLPAGEQVTAKVFVVP